MDETTILRYHTNMYGGGPIVNSDIVGNPDISLSGMSSAVANGRISLGVLSVAVLGLMFFYVATRGRQA